MTNPRNNRRNNNIQNHATQAARRMVRASERRDAGHKVVPSLRPPQIVRLPWNSFTFSATYSTVSSNDITVNVASIRQQIISLMGLSGAPGKIAIKIQSASVWNTAIGPTFAQPSMQGLFWELIPVSTGETYNVRSEQYDHGTLNIPARVGYFWPLADRKEIHNADTDSHVVLKVTVPSGGDGHGNVTVRIHILWNCAASPTTLLGGESTFETIPLPTD